MKATGFRTVCGVVVCLALASCGVVPLTAKNGGPIDRAHEVALGALAAQFLIQDAGGEFADGDDAEQLADYLNDFGQRLVATRPGVDVVFKFVVVNSSARFSLAVPGGTVLVSRGMLLALQSPQQLAMLLSHEVAHILQRHALDEALRGKVLRGHLALYGDTDSGDAVQARLLADFLADYIYTQPQELAADVLTADILTAAGFASADLLVSIDRLVASGEAQSTTLANERQWGQIHPLTTKRRDQLVGLVAAKAVVADESLPQNSAFSEALQPLRQVAPGYALFDQARHQERQQRLPQAIALYLQAATLAPEQSLVLTAVGLAYVKVDDLNSAKHYLRQAVKLNGDYYRSRLGLGYIYLQQGNITAAMEQLQRSHQLLATLQGSYLLAEGYRAQQQSGKAQLFYQRVVEADRHGTLGRDARRQLKSLASE